jgi:hypothetical protein
MAVPPVAYRLTVYAQLLGQFRVISCGFACSVYQFVQIFWFVCHRSTFLRITLGYIWLVSFLETFPTMGTIIQRNRQMSKFTAPLPHDFEAEQADFRKAFASAMVKGHQISPPAQQLALASGDSGAGLVGNLNPAAVRLAELIKVGVQKTPSLSRPVLKAITARVSLEMNARIFVIASKTRRSRNDTINSLLLIALDAVDQQLNLQVTA